jgi:hypothetical protein
VHEFEVLPEPRREEPRPAQAAAPVQSPTQLARQVEGAVRDLLSRRARLRAT